MVTVKRETVVCNALSVATGISMKDKFVNHAHPEPPIEEKDQIIVVCILPSSFNNQTTFVLYLCL